MDDISSTMPVISDRGAETCADNSSTRCLHSALEEIQSTDSIYLADLEKLLLYEPDNLVTDAVDVIKHAHHILGGLSMDGIVQWPHILHSAYSQYVIAYHYDPSDTERYSYLKRRPFLRLSYLSKMLKKIEPLIGATMNCAALDQLASQARDKVQRQIDQVDTKHFAFNKVRSFDTFEPVSGSFDPSMIVYRDLFEFQLLLPSNRWSARITTELIILSDNSVAVCSLEHPGRALMFPVFRRGELFIDQSTASIPNQDPSRKRIVKHGLVLSSGSKFIRLLSAEETKLKIWEQRLRKLLLSSNGSSDSLDLNSQLRGSNGLRISINSSPRSSIRSSISSISRSQSIHQNPLQRRQSFSSRPRQLHSSDRLSRRISKLSSSSSFKRLSLLLGDENFELMEQLKDVLGLEDIPPEPPRTPAPVIVIKGPAQPFKDNKRFSSEPTQLEKSENSNVEEQKEQKETQDETIQKSQETIQEQDVQTETIEKESIQEHQIQKDQEDQNDQNMDSENHHDVVEGLLTPTGSPRSNLMNDQLQTQNLRLRFNDKSNLYQYDTDGSIMDKLSSEPPTEAPGYLPLPLTPDASEMQLSKLRSDEFSFLEIPSVEASTTKASIVEIPAVESSNVEVPAAETQLESVEAKNEHVEPSSSIGMSQLPSNTTISSYQSCISESMSSFVSFAVDDTESLIDDDISVKTALAEPISEEEETTAETPIETPSKDIAVEKQLVPVEEFFEESSTEEAEIIEKPAIVEQTPSPKKKKSLHFPWKSPKKISHEPKTPSDSPNKFMLRVKTNIKRALPLRRSKMSEEFADLIDSANKTNEEIPPIPVNNPEPKRFCGVSYDSMSSLGSQTSSNRSHKYSDSSASSAPSSAPSSISSNLGSELNDFNDEFAITLFRGASFVSRWSGQQWIPLGNGQQIIHVLVSGSGGSIVASGLSKVNLTAKHEVRKSTAHDIQISKDQSTTMYRFITPEAADRFFESVRASRLDVKEQPLLYYKRQNGTSKASSLTSYESSAASIGSDSSLKKRVSYPKRSCLKSDSFSNIATIMEEEEEEELSFPSDSSMTSSSNSIEIRSVFRMPNNTRIKGLSTVTDTPAVPQLLLLNNLRCKFYGVDIHGKWTDGQFARLTVFSIANSTRKAVLIRPIDSASPLFDEKSLDASCFERVGKVGISISLDDNPPKWMVQVKGIKEADHVYDLFKNE